MNLGIICLFYNKLLFIFHFTITILLLYAFYYIIYIVLEQFINLIKFFKDE